MAGLEIDISVIGAKQVDATLASLEKRLARSEKLINSIFSRKDKLNQRSAKLDIKLARDELAAERKAHKLKIKHIRAEYREKERALKKEQQIKTNMLRRQTAEQRATVSTRGGSRGSVLGPGAARVGGAVMAAAAPVLGAQAIVGAGLQSYRSRSGPAANIANQMVYQGDPRSREQIYTSLMSTSRRVSESTRGSVSGAEVLGGIQTATALAGSGSFWEKYAEKFTKIAVASGMSVETAMEQAGYAFSNLPDDVKKDSKKAFQEVSTIMRGSVGSGAEGAIAGEELGRVSGKLMALTGGMQGTKAEAFADVLGFSQIARKGFGSAEETVTGVTALKRGIVMRQEQFAKAGIKTKDEEGNIRSLRELVPEILEKTKGDEAKLIKLLGSPEAVGALGGATELYKTGGTAALDAELKKMSKSISEADVASSFEFATEKVDAFTQMQNNLSLAFEKLIPTINDQLIPMFESDLLPVIQNDLVPALKDAAPALKFFGKLLSISTKLGVNYAKQIGNMIKFIGTIIDKLKKLISGDITAMDFADVVKQGSGVVGGMYNPEFLAKQLDVVMKGGNALMADDPAAWQTRAPLARNEVGTLADLPVIEKGGKKLTQAESLAIQAQEQMKEQAELAKKQKKVADQWGRVASRWENVLNRLPIGQRG